MTPRLHTLLLGSLLVLTVLYGGDGVVVAAARGVKPGRRELNGILTAIARAQKFTTWTFHFKRTGLDPVIAKFADRQPLSLLLPRDEAFRAIPAALRSQITGQKLVKLMQYHMIMEKWSNEFLFHPTLKVNNRAFRTVLGQYVYCLPNTVPGSKVVRFSTVPRSTGGTLVNVIPPGNVGGKNSWPRFLAHGITGVMLPPGLFKM